MVDVEQNHKIESLKRRDFLRSSVRGVALLAFGGIAGAMVDKMGGTEMVWQIDPWKCIWCGKCATECVLTPSAAKCLRDMPVCGYCEICTGYNAAERLADDEAAENQLCPTAAISRRLVPENYPYYEYLIDEDKCIGCAMCAEGCTRFGNGSMYMQVKHELCVDCNECAIAQACPADAFVQVPRRHPYLIKSRGWSRERSEAGEMHFNA
jgi:Na+-translocating ferredoxin:NAD+ oxidoreductase subunit B